MVRYFEDRVGGRFFRVELFDDVLVIHRGAIGTEGEQELIDDSFASHGLPADVLFEQLAPEEEGFAAVLVDDLLRHVEQGHGVTLAGRLRAFYEGREYKQHQGKRCRALDCVVDFGAAAVQGNFYQEYYDRAAQQHVTLMPISSKWVGEDYGYEDEQQWIGVDPSLEDGPVYALYTSGEYEEAYAQLDAFLADLEPLPPP